MREIFIGVARNSTGIHCGQPFWVTLGQFNGNTQIQIAVGGLRLVRQSLQSIHLLLREIN